RSYNGAGIDGAKPAGGDLRLHGPRVVHDRVELGRVRHHPADSRFPRAEPRHRHGAGHWRNPVSQDLRQPRLLLLGRYRTDGAGHRLHRHAACADANPVRTDRRGDRRRWLPHTRLRMMKTPFWLTQERNPVKKILLYIALLAA